MHNNNKSISEWFDEYSVILSLHHNERHKSSILLFLLIIIKASMMLSFFKIVLPLFSIVYFHHCFLHITPNYFRLSAQFFSLIVQFMKRGMNTNGNVQCEECDNMLKMVVI